jgi:signal peptidase I
LSSRAPGRVGSRAAWPAAAEGDCPSPSPSPRADAGRGDRNFSPPSPYAVEGGFLGLPRAQLQEILDAVLARGAPVRFQARGFSMVPTIRDLDLVTVSPLPRRDLRAGDVIAFRQPASGSLVLHRILRAGPEGFLVRGDNLPEADGLVPARDVIGLVTLAERRGAVVYRASSVDSSDGSAAAVLLLLRLRWAFRAARRAVGEIVRAWSPRAAARTARGLER